MGTQNMGLGYNRPARHGYKKNPALLYFLPPMREEVVTIWDTNSN